MGVRKRISSILVAITALGLMPSAVFAESPKFTSGSDSSSFSNKFFNSGFTDAKGSQQSACPTVDSVLKDFTNSAGDAKELKDILLKYGILSQDSLDAYLKDLGLAGWSDDQIFNAINSFEPFLNIPKSFVKPSGEELPLNYGLLKLNIRDVPWLRNIPVDKRVPILAYGSPSDIDGTRYKDQNGNIVSSSNQDAIPEFVGVSALGTNPVANPNFPPDRVNGVPFYKRNFVQHPWDMRTDIPNAYQPNPDNSWEHSLDPSTSPELYSKVKDSWFNTTLDKYYGTSTDPYGYWKKSDSPVNNLPLKKNILEVEQPPTIFSQGTATEWHDGGYWYDTFFLDKTPMDDASVDSSSVKLNENTGDLSVGVKYNGPVYMDKQDVPLTMLYSSTLPAGTKLDSPGSKYTKVGNGIDDADYYSVSYTLINPADATNYAKDILLFETKKDGKVDMFASGKYTVPNNNEGTVIPTFANLNWVNNPDGEAKITLYANFIGQRFCEDNYTNNVVTALLSKRDFEAEKLTSNDNSTVYLTMKYTGDTLNKDEINSKYGGLHYKADVNISGDTNKTYTVDKAFMLQNDLKSGDELTLGLVTIDDSYGNITANITGTINPQGSGFIPESFNKLDNNSASMTLSKSVAPVVGGVAVSNACAITWQDTATYANGFDWSKPGRCNARDDKGVCTDREPATSGTTYFPDQTYTLNSKEELSYDNSNASLDGPFDYDGLSQRAGASKFGLTTKYANSYTPENGALYPVISSGRGVEIVNGKLIIRGTVQSKDSDTTKQQFTDYVNKVKSRLYAYGVGVKNLNSESRVGVALTNTPSVSGNSSSTKLGFKDKAVTIFTGSYTAEFNLRQKEAYSNNPNQPIEGGYHLFFTYLNTKDGTYSIKFSTDTDGNGKMCDSNAFPFAVYGTMFDDVWVQTN